jgi:hypothetical protein
VVPALDIVVTCTDRKAMAPLAHLRVRDLPRQSDGLPDISEWLHQLSSGDTRLSPARLLYQGEAWSASLELEATARRIRGSEHVRLWVVSAGYGLVSVDETLAPYSATFSAGSPDFVGGEVNGLEGADAAQRWWRKLAAQDEAGHPRSITALAERACGDVIVVLSEAYLRACQPDVVEAAAANERLIVISPAAHRSLRLTHAAPPFDARLLTTAVDRECGVSRPIARGTRMSLNPRAARLLVEHFGSNPIDRKFAISYLQDLTAQQPSLRTFDGSPQDDASVKAFISSALTADVNTPKTRLLRAFRDAGNKCEQGRFGALYDEVRSGTYRQESAS